MKKTKEEGVTLVTLVTTIVIILILSSIVTNAGKSSIEYAKFTEFKEELKIIQTKVNELNSNSEINLGNQLTTEQKNLFNTNTISNIIYKDKTEDEKTKIQNGFRYFNNKELENDLQLEGIKRDYLINFEYRYVICYQGVKYDGNVYYMANQIDDFIYNVNYSDKNKQKTCDFEVNSVQEGNRWRIEVSNIKYNGYINNWEVKYRLDEEETWSTANNLVFYVTKEGNYYVKVVHGSEVTSDPQLVSIP